MPRPAVASLLVLAAALGPACRPRVAILAPSTELAPQGSLAFRPDLRHLGSAGWRWSMEEPDMGTLVPAPGGGAVYTAPAGEGVCHVLLGNPRYPGRTARLEVRVKALQGSESTQALCPSLPMAALPLPDGRVLVLGGGKLPLLYDPDLDRMAEASRKLSFSCEGTFTRLQDGRWFILGALMQGPATPVIFDPATGAFTRPGATRSPRIGHAATLLEDGRVLLTGGCAPGAPGDASMEVYDPWRNTFTLLSSTLRAGRQGHTATLLADGSILVAGGLQGSEGCEMELLAPGTFEAEALPSTGATKRRQGHLAFLLPSGRVLLLGGERRACLAGRDGFLEVFDPATRTTFLAGLPSAPRSDASALQLPDGSVLVAGGSRRAIEIFDAWSNTFHSLPGALPEVRRGPGLALLRSGHVLVAGGVGEYPHGAPLPCFLIR